MTKENITLCVFQFKSINISFRQDWFGDCHSRGPNASLDTNIDGLWPLWEYCHNGHTRDIAKVAIYTIVNSRPSISVSMEAFGLQECSS